MSAASFLRVKKLKGAGIIQAAARHNLRELQAEQGASGPIDATRIHLNEVLAGPAAADDVAQLAKEMMQAAGVAGLRKDAVMALELVLSLPADTILNDRAYFADCLRWVQSHFGCPVLSATIHRDEASPHCHVLLLPLRDGRMVGNKLMGGRSQMLVMQSSFYEAVARQHGLRKAPPRLSGTAKQAAAALVLARLKETGDSALRSDLWPAIRDAVENAPQTFLKALGLVVETKTKPPRTMAQIFTSKGKGAKREKTPTMAPANTIAFAKVPMSSNAIAFHDKEIPMENDNANAIAFTPRSTEKTQRLCSVAFAQSSPSIPSRFKPTDGRVTVMDNELDDDTSAPELEYEPSHHRIDRDGLDRDFDFDDSYNSRGGDPFAIYDRVEAPSWQD